MRKKFSPYGLVLPEEVLMFIEKELLTKHSLSVSVSPNNSLYYKQRRSGRHKINIITVASTIDKNKIYWYALGNYDGLRGTIILNNESEPNNDSKKFGYMNRSRVQDNNGFESGTNKYSLYTV